MASRADVERMKRALVDRTISGATAMVVELRAQLREDTPKDTGRTSRGWFATQPVFDGSGVTFSIRHPQTAENPPDPRWLSEGTRPHVIVARRARVLAFPGRDGEMVFRRSVNHPGFAGTGFIERILSPANVADVARTAFLRTRS